MMSGREPSVGRRRGRIGEVDKFEESSGDNIPMLL